MASGQVAGWGGGFVAILLLLMAGCTETCTTTVETRWHQPSAFATYMASWEATYPPTAFDVPAPPPGNYTDVRIESVVWAPDGTARLSFSWVEQDGFHGFPGTHGRPGVLYADAPARDAALDARMATFITTIAGRDATFGRDVWDEAECIDPQDWSYCDDTPPHLRSDRAYHVASLPGGPGHYRFVWDPAGLHARLGTPLDVVAENQTGLQVQQSSTLYRFQYPDGWTIRYVNQPEGKPAHASLGWGGDSTVSVTADDWITTQARWRHAKEGFDYVAAAREPDLSILQAFGLDPDLYPGDGSIRKECWAGV